MTLLYSCFFSAFYQFKSWDGFYIMGILPGKSLIASTVYLFWIIIGSSHGRCSRKNSVLKDSCSESDRVKFEVKSLEKYLYRSSLLVKLQASSKQLYQKCTFFEVFFKDFDWKFIQIY